MKSFASTTSHWKPPTILHGVALLLLIVCVSGQSLQLHFASNFTELRAKSGESAEIQCLLDGYSNGGSFMWSSGPALNSAVIPGHTSIVHDTSGTFSTLTINNVGSADAGQYTCSHSGVEISITLTIITNVEPSFLSVPEHQRFAEGTDAVVLCPVNLGTNPPARTPWTRNGVSVNGDRFFPEDGQLRIQNIRIEDSGDYQCLLNREGHGVIDKRTIRVKVLPQSEFAPKINDTVRKIEVMHGDPLNLPCRLEKRRRNVVYSWLIDTKFEVNYLENTRATLQREVEEFDLGRYTCRAENEYGYDVVDFIVTIIAPPLPTQCTTVIQVPDLEDLDTTVVLKSCDLTTPVQPSELTFTWTRNGTEVDTESEGRFSVNLYGWLTIESITSSDLGIYQVTISNDMGTAVHTVKLVTVSYSNSEATIATQSQRSHNLLASAKTDTVPISLKFTMRRGGATSCTDIQEEVRGFIRRQILKEFGFADVTIGDVTIECPSKGKRFGTIRVTLRGSRARQLDVLIKSNGISPFTLNNGQIVTIEVCASECSLEDSDAPKNKPWITRTAGVVIAVTVIAVMLAGLALLIVILVYYRRRSMAKSFIDEEQLSLASPTNPEKNFVKNKPPYYRSISVNLPITSPRSDNH